MARNWRAEIIAGLADYDIQATDAALDADKTLSFLDSSAAALTPASTLLGAGNSGQVMILIASDTTLGIEIKITNYEGLSNQNFTFASVNDYMCIKWQGVYWELLEKTVGVTNST